jgi:hypothetical protein
VVLASGTYDPAENCGHIQLYVYVHAGAFGFSGQRRMPTAGMKTQKLW